MDADKEQQELCMLAEYFKLDGTSAIAEWACLRSYLSKQKDKSIQDILKLLLPTDLCDAFPVLAQIAGIVLVSPVGTAAVERSFSSKNRICSRLRQTMTKEHLDSLLLISHEGPEQPTKTQLKDIVYTWYKQKPRRIQLP